MGKNETYIELKKPIRTFNLLKISVSYEKGGFNYFTNKEYKRGIYVYFKPCSIKNGIVSAVMMGNDIHEMGFKVFVKELKRKSQNKIDLIFDIISGKPFLEVLANAYENKNYDKISFEIKNAILLAKV